MKKNARIDAMRERFGRAARANEGDPEEAAQRTAGSSGRTELEHAAVVETAIQQAIRQGKFDNLPGAGKPLPGLGETHDPDWWIRRKIETEHLTGLGPPALTLRVENANLEERLDRMTSEAEVRETLEDFNKRIIEARRQLLGGPPVITPTRDLDAEVVAWRARRVQRAQHEQAEKAGQTE